MKQSNLALRIEHAGESADESVGPARDGNEIGAPALDRPVEMRTNRETRRAFGRRSIVIRDQGLRPFRVA